MSNYIYYLEQSECGIFIERKSNLKFENWEITGSKSGWVAGLFLTSLVRGVWESSYVAGLFPSSLARTVLDYPNIACIFPTGLARAVVEFHLVLHVLC